MYCSCRARRKWLPLPPASRSCATFMRSSPSSAVCWQSLSAASSSCFTLSGCLVGKKFSMAASRSSRSTRSVASSVSSNVPRPRPRPASMRSSLATPATQPCMSITAASPTRPANTSKNSAICGLVAAWLVQDTSSLYAACAMRSMSGSPATRRAQWNMKSPTWCRRPVAASLSRLAAHSAATCASASATGISGKDMRPS
mmetsp:Transcript_6036/g.15565  ORF Transcript_6036/g.15565 Transcript_6036/m.15565 type:complete len:200 (+) Transcript_6036:248-847(+)